MYNSPNTTLLMYSSFKQYIISFKMLPHTHVYPNVLLVSKYFLSVAQQFSLPPQRKELLQLVKSIRFFKGHCRGYLLRDLCSPLDVSHHMDTTSIYCCLLNCTSGVSNQATCYSMTHRVELTQNTYFADTYVLTYVHKIPTLLILTYLYHMSTMQDVSVYCSVFVFGPTLWRHEG